MIKADIEKVKANDENLKNYCMEVGTRFEEMSRRAVEDMEEWVWEWGTGSRFVVELGCGDGAALKEFIARGWTTVGVDINEEKLRYAPGITVMEDIYLYLTELEDESIDHVFTHHALEHMIDADKIIEELERVMRPGCIFYAVVPADDHLHSVHYVVFEEPGELIPSGFEWIYTEKQIRNEPEWVAVSRKPL